MNFTEMVINAMHSKRYRVKQYVHVPPKYKRDAKGRFIGGLSRKGYTRKLLDRDAPMVSCMQLMAENFAKHNAVLARLKQK